LALLFGVVAAGAYFFVTWPALRPQSIYVGGNRVVPRDEILKAAAIDSRKNIWMQNTAGMRRRIEAIPYILTAEVHRRPPAGVDIIVTERKPFATLTTAGGDYEIDRDLRVLQSADANGGLSAFIVKDISSVQLGATLAQPDVRALRDDEDALANAQLAPASLSHDKYGDLVVTLHNGIRVLFGDESDLAKKIPLVNPILTQVGRAGRPISTIDLRAPGTPVVVYKR
jgi:cell division protein FtsQ